MDWETLYWPHHSCRGYGIPFSQGYLVKNGTSRGQPRAWRPVTPAMAAGLTDHVWTTGELLAYRVPVEFLDQLHTIEHLFPEWNVVHHSN